MSETNQITGNEPYYPVIWTVESQVNPGITIPHPDPELNKQGYRQIIIKQVIY